MLTFVHDKPLITTQVKLKRKLNKPCITLPMISFGQRHTKHVYTTLLMCTEEALEYPLTPQTHVNE